MKTQYPSDLGRRGFIGTISAGAAAIGLSMLPTPLQAAAERTPALSSPDDPDAWFAQIKGRHRIVYDAVGPRDIFPFAWPRIFLVTNEMTGTPAKDCSVVVILRHEAIPFSMGSPLWEKYHFGEMFKYNDPVSKQPSLRNPFWQPGANDFVVPGLGPVQIGINQLQENGVMFCACNMALTVYSAAVAGQMNMDPAAMKQEWISGLLPGIQVVPSGVWAVGRAQEHGCAYCYVG